MAINPYEPPRAAAAPPSIVTTTDDDLALLTPPTGARIAAASALVGGLFWVVLAFQTSLSFRVVSALTIALVSSMLTVGAGQLVGAAWLRRMRARGAVVLVASSAFGLLLAAFWLVYAMAHGVLALVALLQLPLSAATATFGGISLAPARRADEARARLRSTGFESSF